MKKVFVSYDHDDIAAFNAIKSLNKNPNNGVEFIDGSLSEPVLNPDGHINRRSPFDPYSNPVNNKIVSLLEQADKMLVLIGQDTHSSLWVQWEIETFRKRHSDRDILLMGIKGSADYGVPHTAKDLKLHAWNMNTLEQFIQK